MKSSWNEWRGGGRVGGELAKSNPPKLAEPSMALQESRTLIFYWKYKHTVKHRSIYLNIQKVGSGSFRPSVKQLLPQKLKSIKLSPYTFKTGYPQTYSVQSAKKVGFRYHSPIGLWYQEPCYREPARTTYQGCLVGDVDYSASLQQSLRGRSKKMTKREGGWKSGALTSGFLSKLCNGSFDTNALYTWNQHQEHSYTLDS